MAEESTLTLETRIAHLEEQNEGMKRVGILLFVLLIVMGITMIYQSFTSSEAVTSEGLIITNNGRPRGALTAMPTGHLGMLFYDYQGNLPANVNFSAIPYLDGFAIYDKDGQPRILIGMDDKDNPILAVVSKQGQTQFLAVPPAPAQQPGATPGATATPSAPQPTASPTP